MIKGKSEKEEYEKLHQDILNETIEEIDNEHEKPIAKKIKKTYVLLMAFFLIFLLILNGIAGSYVLNILSGKIISTLIKEDYTIQLKNATIFFGKENYEALLSLYKENQKTEIKVCLLGEKKERDYFVNAIYIPKTFQKNIYSVTAEVCNKDTIISLHTHPYLHCIFSNQDIESYIQYRNINPDMLLALMCDEKRFSFFGY